jgi:hypothetical protein
MYDLYKTVFNTDDVLRYILGTTKRHAALRFQKNYRAKIKTAVVSPTPALITELANELTSGFIKDRTFDSYSTAHYIKISKYFFNTANELEPVANTLASLADTEKRVRTDDSAKAAVGVALLGYVFDRIAELKLKSKRKELILYLK